MSTSEYQTEAGKKLNKNVPFPVILQRIKEDSAKSPALAKEKEEAEKKRLELIKKEEAYNKLTPEQKKERGQTSLKAYRGALGDEVAFRMAKTTKEYMDKVSPIGQKIAEKVNPLAGKAFGLAKDVLDKVYDIIEVPEDLSNDAGAKRVSEKVAQAVKKYGGGKKKKRIRIIIKDI